MAARQNLDVDQGSYWSQSLLWKDADGATIDLTGYTARMSVRREVTDADPVVISLTTENGRITLGLVEDTPGGTDLYNILLEIDAADTEDLPTGNEKSVWRYDLEMVPAGGQVHRLLEGKFIVHPEVTR